MTEIMKLRIKVNILQEDLMYIKKWDTNYARNTLFELERILLEIKLIEIDEYEN